MITWLKNWLATEPALAWTALSNGVVGGTIWAALPAFGITVTTQEQAAALIIVNLINAFIVRSAVTPANPVIPAAPAAPKQGT